MAQRLLQQKFTPTGDIAANTISTALAEIDREKIGSVTNISALKTTIPIVGKIVEVFGYYAANDGGGGTFVWDASSSAADNGGTIIASSTSSNGRWIRNYDSSFVNVLWFGAKRVQTGGVEADAPTNVQAFNTALAVADTFVPAGLYWTVLNNNIDYDSTASTAVTKLAAYDGIRVPQGKTLFGVSATSTIIKAAPNSNLKSGFNLLINDSFSTIKNLQFDGNRLNMSIPVQNGTGNLLKAYPNQREGILYEDLIVRGLYRKAETNPGVEGFGISLFTAKNSTIRNCEFTGNDGSGFHVDGELLTNTPAENILIEAVSSHDNLNWMGMSNYFCKNVTIRNSHFYRNGRNGLNIEWATNLTIENVKCYNNGQAGIGGYGFISNVQVIDSEIFDNSDPNISSAFGNTSAELAFFSGRWRAGTPRRHGTLDTLSLINLDIRPRVNNAHLFIPKVIETSGNITDGYGTPRAVTIDSIGSEKWIIRFLGATNQDYYKPHGIKYKSLQRYPLLLNFPSINRWSLSSSNISTSVVANSEGAYNSSALKLSAIAQNANVNYSKLTTGKKYLIRSRIKNDSNDFWSLKLFRTFLDVDGTTTRFDIKLDARLSNNSVDAGVWFESEFVVDMMDAVAGNYIINIVYEGTTASSSTPKVITVDYVTVEELVSDSTTLTGLPNQIHSSYLNENLGIGTESPAAKLHTVGDIRINASTITKNSGVRLSQFEGNNGGSTVGQIDLLSNESTMSGELRLFRNTNLSNSSLLIYKGDNSTVVNSLLSGNSHTFLNGNAGNVGIGTANVPNAKLQVSGGVAIEPGTAAAPDPGAGNLRVANNAILNGVAFGFKTISAANYNLLLTDCVLAINAVASAITINLFTASGVTGGKLYRFKKIDSSANTVTIQASSGQTIDGVTSYTLTSQNAAVDIVSNGAGWLLF